MPQFCCLCITLMLWGYFELDIQAIRSLGRSEQWVMRVVGRYQERHEEKSFLKKSHVRLSV